MIGDGHAVPRWAEVRGDSTESEQESLRCTDRAELFHRAFSLPGRRMGVLAPIFQVFVPPVPVRLVGPHPIVNDTTRSSQIRR